MALSYYEISARIGAAVDFLDGLPNDCEFKGRARQHAAALEEASADLADMALEIAKAQQSHGSATERDVPGKSALEEKQP